ncbi:hypothetical protein Q7P37_002610 [Cladosporium fusiforme]
MLRTTRLLAPATRRAAFFQHRMQSTYQPPEAPKPEAPKSNPHRDFYKYRSRPVFKAVLIAIFTYEILYWGWLKLESMETKHETEGEIKSLETQIRQAAKDNGATSK